MSTTQFAEYAAELRKTLDQELQAETLEAKLTAAEDAAPSHICLHMPRGVACRVELGEVLRWASSRRHDLEDAVVRTPPETLDDVADVLTMIIKKIEEHGNMAVPDNIDGALRACVHRLAVEGCKTRIKDIYFSHVDFAPGESRLPRTLREVEAVLTEFAENSERQAAQ